MRYLALLLILSGCGVNQKSLTEYACSSSKLIGEYKLEDNSFLVFTKDCTWLQNIAGETYTGYYADYNMGKDQGLVKIEDVWMKYDVRDGLKLTIELLGSY